MIYFLFCLNHNDTFNENLFIIKIINSIAYTNNNATLSNNPSFSWQKSKIVVYQFILC